MGFSLYDMLAELLPFLPVSPSPMVETKILGTRRDECGRTVTTVQAGSYREVGRITAGTTPEGDVTEVHTHVGHNLWEIHHEDLDV